MIRILHISDFHLESENPSNEKLNIITALSNDLVKYCNEETILLFTGDLIDKGAVNFNDKDSAFIIFENIFINTILNENPSLKGKIFIVPGNHDVFRDKIDKYSEAGLNVELVCKYPIFQTGFKLGFKYRDLILNN